MADLKEKISLSEGIAISEQRLVFMQSELQNETEIKQNGIGDGSTVHLTLVAPTTTQQEQDIQYFTSCVSPSLSLAHFRLGLGLEQLLPGGGVSPQPRPPRLPLPPPISHIVHMYDVPFSAWTVFLRYLYCRQLSEGIRTCLSVPVLKAGHLSVLLILCWFVLYVCSLLGLGFLPFFSSSATTLAM